MKAISSILIAGTLFFFMFPISSNAMDSILFNTVQIITIYETMYKPDNDGMSDDCERQYFHSLAPLPNDDADEDGLTNAQECLNNTSDPTKEDTDGDGMPDGWELQYGFDPWANDSSNDYDNDGLSNLSEYQIGTNPTVTDTDRDGMLDGWESDYESLDPLSNDASIDMDVDGLTNYQEYRLGLDPTDGVTDSDGDQLPDWWEVYSFGFNLSYVRSDDPDNDGLTNYQEYQYGTNGNSTDSDGDGMPDDWEIQNGLNPSIDDADDDPDIDELTNLEEYELGKDPNTADNLLAETFPIDTTEKNLPWTDVVTATEIVRGGGNNNQHIIVTVDFSKIHKVNLTEYDPFWFKYLRLFWDDAGNFTPNERDETSSSVHTAYDNCSSPLGETEEWWNYGRWLRFNDDNTQVTRNYGDSYYPYYWNGPFYDSRECVYQLYDDSVDVRRKFLAHHIMREIPSSNGTLYPGESGLGPNYYLKNGGGVSYRFKWILNDKVVLADDGFNYGEAYYWREVRAGEVTEDGWGIVPESPDMNRWVFIKPKSSSKSYQFGPCEVTEADLQDGGDAIICSPQLWGDIPSEREIEVYLYDGGALGEDLLVAVGAANRITNIDFDREGFYVLERQPDGSYMRSKKLSAQDAWDFIKRSGSLTINGSGNNFDNGIRNGMIMASEMDLDLSVHYYMPQIVDYNEYNSAGNTAMRSALQYIFQQSEVTKSTINVQTHSWSGFVVSTSCTGSCSYVQHISYAPATTPERVSELKNGYNSWSGTGIVVWGSLDPLSYYTYTQTLLSSPVSFWIIEVNSSHSLAQILSKRDWSSYWLN